MLMDTILAMFSAFFDDVVLVTDLKRIWMNYMKKYLIIELLATIPGIITWEQNPDIYFLKLVRYG
jgi:hypothetical protein